MKLPQKSPKKSPFHQNQTEKKAKSPKMVNNGVQSKRVRPRNKHDEDWGVDLRNDGFQVCFLYKQMFMPIINLISLDFIIFLCF